MARIGENTPDRQLLDRLPEVKSPPEIHIHHGLFPIVGPELRCIRKGGVGFGCDHECYLAMVMPIGESLTWGADRRSK